MTDIDNSKQKKISKHPIERSFPSNEVEKRLTTYTSIENDSENCKDLMECINGLTKTVSTIATSIEPIVVLMGLNSLDNSKGFFPVRSPN